MQKFIRLTHLIFFSLMAFSINVLAWDGVVSGKINQIHSVSGAGGAPGNADLRIYLDGYPSMCTGAADPAWAYINSNDPNYKGIFSQLMTAYTLDKMIVIYSNKSVAGCCQIGYVVLYK